MAVGVVTKRSRRVGEGDYYIYKKNENCCDGPILTKDIPKCFGRKSGEGVKVKI